MTTTELRARARAELDELGPEPADPHEHAIWVEERSFTCQLLAGLAKWRGPVLRHAALELGDLMDPATVRLLLDSAKECRGRVTGARSE